MKARLALVAAFTGLAALAMPSSAAVAPQVEDPASDANGVSDQGLFSGDPAPQGVPTPVGSQDSKDIISVLFEPVRKNGACFGFTATLTLKAAPSVTNTLYRVRATTVTNPSGFWLQYRNNPKDGTLTTLRLIGGAEAKTFDLENAAIPFENKVVFRVTMKDLKTANESTSKPVKLEALGADIRTDTGVVTAPQFDQAESTSTFTGC